MSIGTFVLPVIGLAAAVLFMLLQKKRLAGALANSTEYTVGSIAHRLGLELVEGDPNLNFLYLMQPAGDGAYGEFERRVRMVGAPYGRPVEFSFGDGRKVSKDAFNLLVKREAVHHFGCTLSLQLAQAVAPFEVTLRSPNEYLVPKCWLTGNVPEASLGDPQLDGIFRLAAADPRVGPAIARAVSSLAHHAFVHVHGGGQHVDMFVTRMGLPYVAHAVEEYLLSLESIACALEGRPAPVRNAAPLMAPAPLAAR